MFDFSQCYKDRMRGQYGPVLCCLLTLPMICAKFCVVPPEYYQVHRDTKATKSVITEVEEDGTSTQSCCIQTEADIQFSSNQKTIASISCTNNPVTSSKHNESIDFQMTLSNLKTSNDTSTKIFVIRNANDTRIEVENILIYGKFVTIKCGPSEGIKQWCLPLNTMTTGTATDVVQSTMTTEIKTDMVSDEVSTSIMADRPLPSFWEENQENIIYVILATVILVLLIIIGCQCFKISGLKKQYTTKQSEETEDVTQTGGYKQRKNTRKSYLMSWHPRFLTERQVSGDNKKKTDINVPHRDNKVQRRKSYLTSWIPPSLRKSNNELKFNTTDLAVSTNNEQVRTANSNQNIQTTTTRTNTSKSQNQYIEMGKVQRQINRQQR